MSEADKHTTTEIDAVVVGAGFAGMYQLYRLRKAGFSVIVLEVADDVGGTWYWNRYPGARCDILTVDYSYSWDPDLEQEWTWSERYATQPEILRYARHVADKHDLRRDIRFNTRVSSASWDEERRRWTIETDSDQTFSARFYVMATGCLSLPKVPDITGKDRFEGQTYFTSTWPHDGVDFSGQRVAVIGTGSSGVQSIPLIAEQAEQLTVFQRTPNFSIPARNGPISDERLAAYRADPAAYREAARWSELGVPREKPQLSALEVSQEERAARYETMWQESELRSIGATFNDILTNAAANDTMRQFLQDKIRATVEDTAVSEALCPTNHYVGTKRPCLDTNYYETFNRPNVRLVDLRTDPIDAITETGIATAKKTFEFDSIVFATGFDAMTGAIVSVDIKGCDGRTLADVWKDGPQTYLGLMAVNFPNLFMITGPGSPSVMSNMMVSIEQHVDWISDTLIMLRDRDFDRIEPTPLAQTRWVQHTNEFADITLMPLADSWYMGANVPGKPRVFLPYIGGVDTLPRRPARKSLSAGIWVSPWTGPGGAQVNDGIIRELKPDVQVMLEMLAELDLPPLEEMGVDGAAPVRAGIRRLHAAGPRRRRDGRRGPSRCRRQRSRPFGYTVRPPPGPIRSPCTSTAAVGCWATPPPTTRYAGDLCLHSTRSSSPLIIATHRKHASPLRLMMGWPP